MGLGFERGVWRGMVFGYGGVLTVSWLAPTGYLDAYNEGLGTELAYVATLVGLRDLFAM